MNCILPPQTTLNVSIPALIAQVPKPQAQQTITNVPPPPDTMLRLPIRFREFASSWITHFATFLGCGFLVTAAYQCCSNLDLSTHVPAATSDSRFTPALHTVNPAAEIRLHRGNPATLQIPITNPSDHAFSVIKVSGSCGCLVAKTADSKLEPRGATTLEIHLDAIPTAGRIDRSVWIHGVVEMAQDRRQTQTTQIPLRILVD